MIVKVIDQYGFSGSKRQILHEKDDYPYHKGLPISSSIAESAVNLVVSHRMAKKRQMRWTDEGAHCLAQVRVAVLNEEFSVKKLAGLTNTSVAANSPNARRAA
ncbi:hypothetical protein [Paraburkholderia hospita]